MQKVEKIEKPWGYEIVWAKTGHYVGKILFIKAGESLSLQYHREKEETLYFEQGECEIETGTIASELEVIAAIPGSVFHIPPGRLHRLIAKTDCRIFEVSTPQLSDVVRLKDRYGRAPTPPA